jgi:signal transduction histidine kinase
VFLIIDSCKTLLYKALTRQSNPVRYSLRRGHPKNNVFVPNITMRLLAVGVVLQLPLNLSIQHYLIPSTYVPGEAQRLAALYKTELLDTAYEKEFNDIVLLASKICKVPVSLISLVDKDRQWFKARIGLETEETGRDVSFCSHAILGSDLFEVADASRDERFFDNPLVTGDPSIRYYAGVPLVNHEGHKLGTLCVIDTVARRLDEDQLFALQALAAQVMKLVELRLRNKELKNLSRLQHRINSITAHDVRNPLNALHAIVSMQEANKLSPKELAALLPLMKTQLESTLHLLDNLVNWGKMQMLNYPQQQTQVSLHRIVEICMGELQLNALKKQNAFINKVDAALLIYADEHALRFVLRNLLSNANKFTSGGTITTSYNVTNNQHTISVADTGIGMEVESAAAAGDLTFTNRDGTGQEKGSGLGLSLVKEQLQKMQGGFSIDSKQGRGTKVDFYFPVQGKEKDALSVFELNPNIQTERSRLTRDYGIHDARNRSEPPTIHHNMTTIS